MLADAVSVRLRCVRRLAPAPAADDALPGGSVPGRQIPSPVHLVGPVTAAAIVAVSGIVLVVTQPSAWAATGRWPSLGVWRMGASLCLHCIGSESRHAGKHGSVLFPIWCLVALAVFARLDRREVVGVGGLFIAALTIHNLAIGMLPLRDRTAT